jgi:hypothetical protein
MAAGITTGISSYQNLVPDFGITAVAEGETVQEILNSIDTVEIDGSTITFKDGENTVSSITPGSPNITNEINVNTSDFDMGGDITLTIGGAPVQLNFTAAFALDENNPANELGYKFTGSATYGGVNYTLTVIPTKTGYTVGVVNDYVAPSNDTPATTAAPAATTAAATTTAAPANNNSSGGLNIAPPVGANAVTTAAVTTAAGAETTAAVTTAANATTTATTDTTTPVKPAEAALNADNSVTAGANANGTLNSAATVEVLTEAVAALPEDATEVTIKADASVTAISAKAFEKLLAEVPEGVELNLTATATNADGEVTGAIKIPVVEGLEAIKTGIVEAPAEVIDAIASVADTGIVAGAFSTEQTGTFGTEVTVTVKASALKIDTSVFDNCVTTASGAKVIYVTTFDADGNPVTIKGLFKNGVFSFKTELAGTFVVSAVPLS